MSRRRTAVVGFNNANDMNRIVYGTNSLWYERSVVYDMSCDRSSSATIAFRQARGYTKYSR